MVKDAAYQNLAGIALMTAGIAFGAAADTVTRAVPSLVDTRPLAVAVRIEIALTFGAAAFRLGSKIALSELRHRAVLLRALCEAIGVYLTVLALSRVSLGKVSALAQTVPLLVTVGAAIHCV